MTPTDMAKMLFSNSGRWTQTVVEANTGSEDIKNIAAAIRDMAGGLENMAIGLRATYMLLEKIERSLAAQNRGR